MVFPPATATGIMHEVQTAALDYYHCEERSDEAIKPVRSG
jgi:hypothetical protein